MKRGRRESKCTTVHWLVLVLIGWVLFLAGSVITLNESEKPRRPDLPHSHDPSDPLDPLSKEEQRQDFAAADGSEHGERDRTSNNRPSSTNTRDELTRPVSVSAQTDSSMHPFIPPARPTDPVIADSTWPPPDPRMLAKRRLWDQNFPPKQPSDQCKARGLRGGPADPNKKLLDHITVQPDNQDGHTLFCMVYTIEKNHGSAAATVRDTWASRCDGFAVMSTAEDPSLPAVKVSHEGAEEYGNIWQKVRGIWKYVHAAYRDEFDWFIIGGDDLFVIAPNLRAYLLSDEIRSESQGGSKPMFLGRRFQIPKGELFNSGGAGYVLNRAALDLLVSMLDNPKCRPHQHVFAEDVNVARCLSLSEEATKPYDTRDANGGERFHPFTPGQHLNWQPPAKRLANGRSPDWYVNYNEPWGLKTGFDCCSADSVSFHYVKPNLMPHVSALLFDCREGK